MKKQRKYYFMNYSKPVALALKIKQFLDKQEQSSFELPYQVLGRAIRKPLHKQPLTYRDKEGQLKYFRSSLINPQVLATVRKGFVILQDLGYLKSFNFEHTPKQDSYMIQLEKGVQIGDFADVVKQSQYFPVEGEKQQLTDTVRRTIHQYYTLDYQTIMAQSPTTNYATLVKHFTDVLPRQWLLCYQASTQQQTNVYEMPRAFTFMFDVQSEIPDVSDDDYIEDRVVVSWGLSKQSEVKREASRMAGYLQGAFEWTDKNTDKGHFIGHSLGGGVDENLFAQRKDINRGRSARGKVYRQMEQYCADNPGTFCFSRPLYGDFSTRPFVLEYGVLKQDGHLWVEQFDNV